MNYYQELKTHLFRLVHLARSIVLKRALVAIDLDPNLNFWRLIYSNLLDIAVLDWCKIFGSDEEATHWKKIIPPANQDQFRIDLLAAISITADEWIAYWNELKNYRDSQIAHHIKLSKVSNYPSLDIALRSSFFYYK